MLATQTTTSTAIKTITATTRLAIASAYKHICRKRHHHTNTNVSPSTTPSNTAANSAARSSPVTAASLRTVERRARTHGTMCGATQRHHYLLTLLATIILASDLHAINAEFLLKGNNRTTTTTATASSAQEMQASNATTAATTIIMPASQATNDPAAATITANSRLIGAGATSAEEEATNTIGTDDIDAYNNDNDNFNSSEVSDARDQPPAESLTKGFLIPTFLPPFPAFAMADLPSYTTAAPTTTTTPVPPTLDALQLQQQQLYLSGYNQQMQEGRSNFTLPVTNVTVQMGNHAYLPCRIRRLVNNPISWVRSRDGHILSVDQTTFIADQRFQSIFKGENEYTWSLQIKYAQPSDEGWYECQASTEPKMSAKVFLSIVVPTTELIGDQNRFVKAGSKVALHCIVRGTLDPPTYIIWFRGKTQITDDNKDGWFTQIDRNIFGNMSENQNTIGSLIIPFVRKKDSGNYTCQPSNAAAVSVDLHVLSGEYSASAIMSAASTSQGISAFCFLLILLLLTVRRT